MHSELIYEIDESGTILNPVDRKEAHEKGILHIGVQCWVINDENKILIQQRSINKPNSPGKWDVSFGGHCSFIENGKDILLENIIKEGQEEIGIEVILDNVKFLGNYFYSSQNGKNQEQIFVYMLRVENNINFNDGEVQEVKWIDKDELYNNLLNNQQEFANRLKSFELLVDKLDKEQK